VLRLWQKYIFSSTVSNLAQEAALHENVARIGIVVFIQKVSKMLGCLSGHDFQPAPYGGQV
jgi:hypothetical protein